MNQIAADFDTLLHQASMTASNYLANAIHNIDRHFGEGYAAKHPCLVAAFIQTCAQDFHTGMIAKTLG